MLAISIDTLETHRQWQEEELSRMVKGGAGFPLVSDPEGRIGSLYGMYDPERRTQVRGHVLIDPEGKVQALELLADPVGRNIAEILRQLRALQYYRSHGALLPSGWQPGRPVIPPEPDPEKQRGRVCRIWETRNAF